MKSKKPLTDEALQAFESSLDIAAELRKSVKEMIAKKGSKVEVSQVVSARIKSGLSQSQFAELLGVSVRTLQEWEQGRRSPSKAAQTLITIAERRPEVLREVAAAG
ncbi:helix-turn-helix domain-containing protein [Sulfuritalea sp.]|uniref:helix-turn-helix domain-containing protein n=1 Tax=Sulfuritalea sp. TaxID=2480090 RepID=UPI00286EA1A8|nr:helix-turn-helix domain-containing protein [Sulfuritalea sp.]